jgi:uncharacterized membrane protein YfcA
VDVLSGAGLAAAAFAAGAINAIAGGGSLVSFPALVAAGYSTKSANVTNSVALWPGYVGGSFGYRQELTGQGHRLKILCIPSVLGALAGSVILLATPESAFDRIVPFLILFACALMATQERLAFWALRHRLVARDEGHVPALLITAVFVLAIYGAYFGAGLGILTLAVLGILLPDDLQRSNALKGALSLVINAIAVLYFAAFGPVAWAPAAIMAVAAIIGGYAGVRIARGLSRRRLRKAVITYGVAVAVPHYLR